MTISSDNFSKFVEESFKELYPNVEFLNNWHIDLICYNLEQAAQGKIKRLIINVPPRSLKSFCVSVAWPAWLLGHNQYSKIMVASYSQILSVKHSIDCRRLIASPYYQHKFPKVQLSKEHNQKSKFMTINGGYRFATSVMGTATGEGGDILIVDDPHNAIQASSPQLRTRAVEWFEQTFVSRLNDKKEGVIIIVMQRLHEEDLTGYLLNKANSPWQLLKLAAIEEEQTTYYIGAKEILRKAKEPLHAQREGHDELCQVRQELGEQAFSAQYLQLPITKKGNLIKAEWIKKYKQAPENYNNIIHSWDMACKPGIKNDYSVCTIWGELDGIYYLLNVFKERLSYPDLKKEVLSLSHKWQPDIILIEDKASGTSIIQDLEKEKNLPIIAVKVLNNKQDRFMAITTFFEAGKIIIPESCDWVSSYEREILNFPFVANDDQADSTSQFLNYVRQRKANSMRINIL
jgi:predicted phage terminase large subunit-like protein